MNKIIFVLISILAFSFNSSAQATATATASATINSPITIAKSADGIGGGGAGASASTSSSDAASDATSQAAAANSAASAAAGIDPATTTTGVKVSKNGATISVVAFTVTGSESSTFAISLAPSVTLTSSSGDETITASLSTNNISSTGNLAGGSQTIVIGAILPSSITQTQGNYSGSFHFTASYN